MISIQGEIHSSKNSRKLIFNRNTRRLIIAKSDAARADESMLAEQLDLQKSDWDHIVAELKYPYYVKFYFRRRTQSKWDFVNLVQGVADAMVKAGYIPDDDVLHLIPVWGGWDVQPQNPGVDFFIESDRGRLAR